MAADLIAYNTMKMVRYALSSGNVEMFHHVLKLEEQLGEKDIKLKLFQGRLEPTGLFYAAFSSPNSLKVLITLFPS